MAAESNDPSEHAQRPPGASCGAFLTYTGRTMTDRQRAFERAPYHEVILERGLRQVVEALSQVLGVPLHGRSWGEHMTINRARLEIRGPLPAQVPPGIPQDLHLSVVFIPGDDGGAFPPRWDATVTRYVEDQRDRLTTTPQAGVPVGHMVADLLRRALVVTFPDPAYKART